MEAALATTGSLVIQRGENPDIFFEFFEDAKETVRMNMTGAVLAYVTNIPGLVAPIEIMDAAQGVFRIPLSGAVTAALRPYTQYLVTMTAIDASGGVHIIDAPIGSTR